MLFPLADLIARLGLATVFAFSGVAKLRRWTGTREMLVAFGVPARAASAAGSLLVGAELLIACGLLVPLAAWGSAVGAALLLLLFCVAIGMQLAKGSHPACQCFGAASSAPISGFTLLRNAGFLALAAIVLAFGPAALRTWQLDQLLQVTPVQALLIACAVLGVALLGAVVALQLATLGRLSAAGDDSLPMGAGRGPQKDGLAIGTLAPTFALTDTEGELVALEDLLARRKPAVLFFVRFDCPPCRALAPEVERWQHTYRDEMSIVRISNGMRPEDEYSLMQAGTEVSEVYHASGTPSAILVLPDGTVGSAVAQGSAAIRSLVKRAAAEQLLRPAAVIA